MMRSLLLFLVAVAVVPEPTSAPAMSCADGADHGAALDADGLVDEAASFLLLLLPRCAADADVQFTLGNAFQRKAHSNFVLGESASQRRHLAAAVLHFAAARAIDPEDASSAFNHGGTLWQLGERTAAVEALAAAVALDATDVAALHMLAGFHKALGQVDEAVRLYRAVTRLDPTDEEARHFTQLNAEGGGEGASIEYVGAHFDSYADKFERHLVGALQSWKRPCRGVAREWVGEGSR